MKQFVVSKNANSPELSAIRLSVETTVETLEGPIKAYPGDIEVTGTNGEKWPVPKDKLDEMYETVDTYSNKLTIKARPETRFAYQTLVEITFTAGKNEFTAKPLDWIVRRSNGDVWAVDQAIFFNTYTIQRPSDTHELVAPVKDIREVMMARAEIFEQTRQELSEAGIPEGADPAEFTEFAALMRIRHIERQSKG